MTSRLTGSTALVTGSTSGIGRAIAEALAQLDAHVIVSGRDPARGEDVVAGIRAAGGKADFISADLSDSAGAHALAEQATAVTGRIDILVNNAGIYTFGPTTEFTDAAFDRMYNVNVKAPYVLVGDLAPGMAERGGGAIINITTGAAVKGLPSAGLYGSSKAAIDLLTKAWAAEFGPRGVRVNAVSPGPIHTAGTEAMGEGAIESFAEGLPAGRVGQPHEIATAVAYLASDDASFVHGAIFSVDGGFTVI
ncbi:SDR family NAD(P)-dependent oxidoreductase [Actinacidiphila rubida]|uniref:NAD(P)-dependent dehydrogenase, short-chain alcohol dehydrogenase family n=1 Tax=Actinacidiphila rubida TaxID=310780 RepID=A0A1H8PXQ8_9ACTN|nr:SDR family oxidoreductase [Actinacidiphila rubida]SEO46606.1 NAD(P)-dependent dehydrogenase, short-chain alcohol dehydrogenase family [Actinacidiphila rubida]